MKKLMTVGVCAAVASAIALGVRAEVVYVDAHAEEGGDGSPGAPYKDLVTAVTEKTAADTVFELADGTYPIASTIALEKRSLRSASGNRGACVVDAQGLCKAFYITSGTIDGITIRNGFMNLRELGLDGGGGAGIHIKGDGRVLNAVIENCNVTNDYKNFTTGAIWGNSGTHTISNCVIRNCRVDSSTTTWGGAAAYGMQNGGTPIFYETTFSNCWNVLNFNSENVERGGAVFINSGGDFFDCHFYDNGVTNLVDKDSGWGGAIYMRSGGTPGHGIVSNCWFSGNSAREGGAFYRRNSGTYYIYNTTFTNNVATHGRAGAGGANAGAVYAYDSHFYDNRAKTTAGAVYATDASVYVRCDFRGNSAVDGGGAVVLAGGSTLDGALVTNNIVVRPTNNDEAGGGGVMVASGNYAYIYNSKIVCNGATNTANNAKRLGGGIHNHGYLTMTNCLVEGNWEGGGGAGGLNMHNNNSLAMRDCTFRRNTSLNGASALFSYDSPVVMTNCLFELNYPKRVFVGVKGNTYIRQGVIHGCVFRQNDTTQTSGYSTSSLMSLGNDMVMTETLFEDNLGGAAAGNSILEFIGSNVTVDRCLFRRNKSTGTSAERCGLIGTDCGNTITSLSVRNCCFLCNTNYMMGGFYKLTYAGGSTAENRMGLYWDNNTFVSNCCAGAIFGGDGQTASPNLFFYNNKFKDNCGDGGKKIFWAKFYGSYSDHAHANWVQGDVDATTFPMGGTDGNIVSDSERKCINAGETLAWMAGAKTFRSFEPTVTERTAGYGIGIDFGRLRSRLAAGAPDIGAEESGTGLVLMVK